MEEALNFGGMVQLAVQIISLLVPLEAEIDRRHPYLKACYTKDLALNMVAVLRHYQRYFHLIEAMSYNSNNRIISIIEVSLHNE